MTEKLTYELPEGFNAEYSDGVLKVEGNGEETEKQIQHSLVEVDIDGETVTFTALRDKKNIISVAKTYRSHLQNMAEGLENAHVYKLKGVYAHFPMTIKKEGDEVVVENFMGERFPRRAEIMEGVDVQVDGDEVTVKGPNKDKVSQTAARIEQLSRKGNRDPRTFQDGIYITEVTRSE
ncbi:50S ribosomal protein L6 [Candidatus Nanohalovita haloferacivicina]|uniref:50S ribosomal protein L6 n=1 Tax=Candidatus Nanohalovita haloferacivicina TaxID=2978046 RepID=UPI00325FA841|nr:Ribosomal protein L6P [Candidatus Nanohalobia archaeon BNXNv]